MRKQGRRMWWKSKLKVMLEEDYLSMQKHAQYWADRGAGNPREDPKSIA